MGRTNRESRRRLPLCCIFPGRGGFTIAGVAAGRNHSASLRGVKAIAELFRCASAGCIPLSLGRGRTGWPASFAGSIGGNVALASEGRRFARVGGTAFLRGAAFIGSAAVCDGRAVIKGKTVSAGGNCFMRAAAFSPKRFTARFIPPHRPSDRFYPSGHRTQPAALDRGYLVTGRFSCHRAFFWQHGRPRKGQAYQPRISLRRSLLGTPRPNEAAKHRLTGGLHFIRRTFPRIFAVQRHLLPHHSRPVFICVCLSAFLTARSPCTRKREMTSCTGGINMV